MNKVTNSCRCMKRCYEASWWMRFVLRIIPLHFYLLMTFLQVTYLRFLYSMIIDPLPPASCIRTVNGMLNAEVTGWVAKRVHIGFLMPMTILNLASLIVVLISIARANRGFYEFDPTDPRPLLLAEPSLDKSDDSGWADSVLYRSREVRKCRI